MRDISPGLQSHLDSGATTLCHIWTLIRKDGTVLGFTDHDMNLQIGDIHYLAMNGMSAGDTDSSLGFAIDNGNVKSVLSDERISSRDIDTGLYDSALLICALVNWQDVSQRVNLSRGQLGEIKQSGDRFEAEWVGESAKLDRSQGRVFSRICDASFGDARCGLNKDDFTPGTECPRSYAACREQFGNTKNFRGFPYLMGDDALTAAPLETGSRDGGSRYSGPLL